MVFFWFVAVYNLCSTLDSKSITTRNDRISFSLIGSDNLSDKFESLNVSSSLQISILAGMIEPEGSGSFLKRKKGQIRESSIHVRCHCSLRNAVLKKGNMTMLWKYSKFYVFKTETQSLKNGINFFFSFLPSRHFWH